MRAQVRAAVAIALTTITVMVIVLLAPDQPSTPPGACTEWGPENVGRKSFPAPPCFEIERRDAVYIATLETSMGTVRVLLDPVLAHVTVNNFVFLARHGFFDGQVFHRIESDADHAIVQTGDPTGTGRGGAGYTYAGEDPSPITRYVRGVVAMANTGSPASNASQFFIVVRDWDALGPPGTTPRYTFFGIVLGDDSLRVLDRMVETPRTGTTPNPPIRLITVTVEERARG